MGTIIGFHTKRILRSPFFLAGYGCLVAFLLFFEVMNWVDGYKAIHYPALYHHFIYFEMSLMPVLFCIGVYYTRQTSSLEIAGMHSRAATVVGKIIATVCASLSLCVIPTLFVIVHAAAEGTDMGFNFIAWLYIIIRWTLIIFAVEATAFLCAYFLHTPICYVLCLPATIVFSFVNRNFFGLFLGLVEETDLIPSMLNMQPWPSAAPLDYTGATVDLFLLSKLLYVAIFLGVALSIIWLCTSHRKALPALLLVVLLLTEVGSLYAWTQLFPRKYDEREKLYVADYPTQAATIRSYSGEVHLSEFSRFDCTMEVLPAGQRSITFRLDESLAVQSLTWDGQPAQYSREGDQLTLTIPSQLAQAGTLSIQYSGRIYYFGSVHTVNILTTSRYAALPPRFAFLPIIDGSERDSSYDLTVNAGNTVISNLDVEQTGSHTYAITGDAKTICLFSGYFSEYERDGILFYRSKYNQLTDYNAVYEMSLSHSGGMDQFGQRSSSMEPYANNLKKVFLIYAMYGSFGIPTRYEDYVLLNYGFSFA